jgi:hypothetical protein
MRTTQLLLTAALIVLQFANAGDQPDWRVEK